MLEENVREKLINYLESDAYKLFSLQECLKDVKSKILEYEEKVALHNFNLAELEFYLGYQRIFEDQIEEIKKNNNKG